MITLRNATEKELPIIQSIGTITYRPTYLSFLGEEQIAYMLSNFYSIASLQQQMIDGHIFLIASVDGNDAGFASYAASEAYGYRIVKLHKLYVLPSAHGLGIGKLLMNEVKDKAIVMGAEGLILNVNRYNKAKDFYEKAGFKVKETVDIAIGNGFYMNDFVMELPLSAAANSLA